MKLKRLTLGQFRNIDALDISLSESFNLFVGPNGQGKTSILEAIAFLGDLRSFRSNRVPDLMRFKELSTRVCGQLEAIDSEQQLWSTKLECTLIRQAPEASRVQKRVRVNERTFGSSLAYLRHRNQAAGGGFHTIAFNPSDHELVQGSPSERRDAFNRMFGSFSDEYLSVLRNYQRVLEQRNALLKNSSGTSTWLGEFDDGLVRYGAQIIVFRAEFLKRLEAETQKNLVKIAPQQKDFKMSLQTTLFGTQNSEKTDLFVSKDEHFSGQNSLLSIENVKSTLEEALRGKARFEREAGVTLVGPHRDDFGLWIGEAPLKGIGSQGEVRSVLLAMKLAEIRLYQEFTGMKPLLLIDDFSSELDRSRRERLFQELKSTGLQTFVTSTESLEDWNLGDKGTQVFSVRSGHATPTL